MYGSTSYYSCSTWPLDLATSTRSSSMLAAVAQLHAPGKSKRALIWRLPTNDRISRNFRKLQNTNSAAAEIAIRFGPKILLECSVRETGPKYPCTRIDYGYKSSFSLNHYVQSLRPAHCSTVYVYGCTAVPPRICRCAGRND